jgi:DNA-binding transcriptional ArsR family regulator
MGDADSLSLVFFALSDATRRGILSRLANATLSVSELAAPYDMTLPAITKHLKVLERAGLISRTREAQWRPCRFEPKALEPANDWIAQYRAHWEESFDRLDAYLEQVQSDQTGSTSKGKHGKSRTRK